MRSPRERIIDGLANIMLEAGAKALESISPPVEPVTYVEVPPQRSLPSSPPVQRVVTRPAQTSTDQTRTSHLSHSPHP